ncbi:MAG TPA: aspartate kinase [Candidatus Gallimonas intestinigallinarum]|uniref:Aspartokinase n=1 Tax=Candidatus Gallimonas intestinigallinarum TaxID=2838604 RepID=A0A9D2IWE0_9FIRM|nr:aspartate kinase [Candidatus Gallimonas intestinigallinarum]
MIKVCKFGGTSMADGITMLRVKSIIESDPARRYVVVSAPGKRFGGDIKVTDLLYETYDNVVVSGETGAAFEKICERFRGIVSELKLDMDIDAILAETGEAIVKEASPDFCASRGEYLSGRVMAELLGIPFIDARDVVKFGPDGKLDNKRTYALLAEALKGKKRALVTGFYGEDANGRVKTFSRGGSDISGAIVARAAGADLYENWTDVSGFLACDPRIVENPVPIRSLSYKELRELSYMGANVLHSESIFPVREVDIPIRIKNTFRPEDEGTEILPTSRYTYSGRRVTGIAGKKNFTVIFLEKSLMNEEIGFTYRTLAVFMKHGISFEHIPTGIDTMSFVIDSAELKGGLLEEMCDEIRAAVNPDSLRVINDIALIAVVGHGMTRSVGVSARLFEAIARAGVNVRMIDQGSSELNIIVGVDNENYERTLKAVYEEFFD